MKQWDVKSLTQRSYHKVMIWTHAGGGGFMQHPWEASRLRLVLLNMERGHTAKAAGSFWLAVNVAIQAEIGWADAVRHHVVGTKPFWTEAKQGGTDIKTQTCTPIHNCYEEASHPGKEALVQKSTHKSGECQINLGCFLMHVRRKQNS